MFFPIVEIAFIFFGFSTLAMIDGFNVFGYFCRIIVSLVCKSRMASCCSKSWNFRSIWPPTNKLWIRFKFNNVNKWNECFRFNIEKFQKFLSLWIAFRLFPSFLLRLRSVQDNIYIYISISERLWKNVGLRKLMKLVVMAVSWFPIDYRAYVQLRHKIIKICGKGDKAFIEHGTVK